MLEKLNDSHEVQVGGTLVEEDVLTSERLVFLDELPSVPVYAESLPTGLIEDEI